MSNPLSKILIVDDNTFYLSLLKTILRDVEVELCMACSGKEALGLLDANDFALAILDIEMPGMDGYELAKHIRDHPNRDLIPIIFLTAYFSDELQMFKGYDYGAIDYLTKPVNKTIFLNKVRIFLELDRKKRDLIASNDSLQKSKLELEMKQNLMKEQNKALKKAQLESEESRKKYIKLYDFAPTGYFTINREGKILKVNHKATYLFGKNSESLINCNFTELIDSGDIDNLNSFLTQIFEKKSYSGCEVKLIKAKPAFVYLEGAIIDKERTYLLSMVDITDRKEAQRALKESEELYHSLLKTSPDGIIITDMKGRITEASDIALELLGCKNEIEGFNLADFISEESKKVLTQIYKGTISDGILQNIEMQFKRADKMTFTGEISTSLIRKSNGESKAFMSVIRDISERKIIEKQLRHTERMAGIGELATGMAHEINQPLNTISLSIDNILYSIDHKTCTETYLKGKLNKVFDNISRIKKIIDHVRIFSRDQDDFMLASFDVNTSIQNSISMVYEQVTQKEIDLTFTPDKNLLPLTGNAYRFEQVILNMLINAVDAVEEKKKKNCSSFRKKIDISTRLIEGQTIIEIKDNGIGIKIEHIDNVLLPFYTTKDPGKGTGLGLSISYGIIKELGGEIDIQSKSQIGTTIRISIPVQDLKNNKHSQRHVQ